MSSTGGPSAMLTRASPVSHVLSKPRQVGFEPQRAKRKQAQTYAVQKCMHAPVHVFNTSTASIAHVHMLRYKQIVIEIQTLSEYLLLLLCLSLGCGRLASD